MSEFELADTTDRILAMSPQAVDKVRSLESELLKFPQVDIATDHVLHGGMYSRTICIPAGTVLTGAFVRVPTLLVFSGEATVNIGDVASTLTGYHVLAASAQRSQAIVAHADTHLTMVFATQAKTVEEAEAEFTDDVDMLMSRKLGAVNHVTITGE
ncbi:MAG: hypothetical protein EPN31_06230 [Castellaniella sp.]|uniref:hypothetical protein n=1 Tax=Castellaniella sp. TaxID=1955812 RepID=UPI0012124BCF|nr:hypothetical protein [Castellaniella sp.]TAN29580.1 MAG: hypothetical protein EPN31_06230 [Castellaniella sp.]